MFDHLLYVEIKVREQPEEIARAVAYARMASLVEHRPSPVRAAVAATIARFGIFLNGSTYHCPEAADPQS
jgi:hypothetical protein